MNVPDDATATMLLMGQDAVALVRIAKLRVPKGSSLSVVHRKDCSFVLTGDRFDGLTADDHAVRLRSELGRRLDAHEDKRGILFFPDVSEPTGETYTAIVRELGSAGSWGSASRPSTTKRAARADRLLRETAAQRGYDREWFAERFGKTARRAKRAELEDFVLELTNTLVDDHGGDEGVVQDAVEACVGAWVAGESPLFDASARGAARPRKAKAPPLTKPGEPGYDPDVAEMIRLFGGDEATWRQALPQKRT